MQDGLRLLIVFENHGEYELDANTLDEKNKVFLNYCNQVTVTCNGSSLSFRCIIGEQSERTYSHTVYHCISQNTAVLSIIGMAKVLPIIHT